jgi:hypothetical protein
MVPSPADRPDPGCPDPSGVLTAVDSPRPEEPVRPRVVLAACSVGLFLAFLQITQTISALGAIQLDLGLSGAQLCGCRAPTRWRWPRSCCPAERSATGGVAGRPTERGSR